MSKFKPQYKRLLFIDRKIRAGAFPNCSSLAKEWETSTRTMQRDIDYLKYELDAPIEYDAIKHGFYYANPAWFLPSVMLSEGDLMALLIGQQALQMYRGTPVADELQRIYGKLAELLPDKIKIGSEYVESRFSFSGMPTRTINPDIWKILLRAVLDQKALEIQYQSPTRRELVPHVIHPYHCANIEGDWYVLAREDRWGDVAQFAISRIKQAKPTSASFAIPDDFDAEELISKRFGRNLHAGIARTVTVRLHIGKKLAHYVEEISWHPRQRIKRRKDGSLELILPVPHISDIEPWIMSLGEHVNVLAPTELRKTVLARHVAAAKARL